MALSNARILEEKKKGNIIISPYRRGLLQTSSYDVRLGEWYYRKQKPGGPRLHNPYNQNHVKRRWGKVQRAEKAKKVFARFGIDAKDYTDIKPNARVVVLAPGENILAHTYEFIGGQNVITTSMQAKSSFGRNQITVCMCAGWGDIDYVNRWTMEIKNHDEDEYVIIVVGQPIAQIIFDYAGKIIPGSSYAQTGSYQQTASIIKLKKTWKPEMMLPKLKIKRIR